MAQERGNDGSVVSRSAPGNTTRSAPVPWAGRVRTPNHLDLSTDRGESFHVWKESWEDYVLLTGLADAEPKIQLAALKNSMTPESRRVLRNLELTETQRADPEAVLTALESFAVGQINEVIERKKFNERRQADGEIFDDFLTSLRELSRACNFCATCNDSLIRDRIVMGLRSAETVKRLCAVQNLSLAHAIDVCRAEEAATRDVVELRSGGHTQASAHRVHAGEYSRGARGRSRDSSWCAACGRRRHRAEQLCPARGQRCRNCQQLHHFAAVCPHPAGHQTESLGYREQHPTAPRGWRGPRPPQRQWSSPPASGSWTNRYQSPYRSTSPPSRRPWSPPQRGSPTRTRPRRRQEGQRVRFQSSEERSDYSSDGDARRPSASTIVAVTSVQSAPRVRLDVAAQRRVSLLALPDTGADICVGGLDFLEKMGEYPENLLPAEQHPCAANGETITSVGILPVSLTLGQVTTDESIHILRGVSGLLISWKATRELHIIPDQYPRQISKLQPSETADQLDRHPTGRTKGVTRRPSRATPPEVTPEPDVKMGSTAVAQGGGGAPDGGDAPDSDPVYMSQLATTEKSVQQTSAKNPITGPVYMSKAPRSTEYFDRGVSENFV